MTRHVTAPGAAASRTGATADRRPPASRMRMHERPETALEQLFRTWIDAGLPRGFGLLGIWLRRLRHRRELADLTPAQLSDVGLDPGRVRHEIDKPFWMA